MAERFDFHGFSSLKAYEKECARCGFKTRRVPVQKDGEPYFVFILTSPTGNGVETWYLFRSEFENPIMDGVSGLIAPNDWIETLSLFGFALARKERRDDGCAFDGLADDHCAVGAADRLLRRAAV